MITRISALLSADRLGAIRTRLEGAAWEDGRATAGHQSAQVKSNLQLPQNDPVTREIGEEIVRALNGLPSSLRTRLASSLASKQPASPDGPKEPAPWARYVRRNWVEILVPGAVGFIVWLAFYYR